MRITYNAPFTLTYTLVCFIVVLLTTGLEIPGVLSFFTVYPFNTPYMQLVDPLTYLRLFSHAMGHANWMHFLGNFSYILLIGPILEEKYGSKLLLEMSFITALITGILNASFFNNALLGASGIVFMLILLASFTNVRSGVIPLTFILITALYIGQEIYQITKSDNVSQFAHILGGICGGIFGYVFSGNKTLKKSSNQDTGALGV
ncbi:MAG TPA: rhomboid family intramembrane serine protease [Microscillaceae bacterium]|jgi:membrane associated rhomboid family serine protease|nr:rhomboid family intramembrane serine protease [Microscillaceae bacterium]